MVMALLWGRWLSKSDSRKAATYSESLNTSRPINILNCRHPLTSKLKSSIVYRATLDWVCRSG